jgi:hypothetical protein
MASSAGLSFLPGTNYSMPPVVFACNRLVHVRKSRNSFLFDIFKGVDVEKGPGLRPIIECTE